MYTLLLIAACLVVAAIFALVVFEVLVDKWAGYELGAREAVGLDDVIEMDDTKVFDPKPDLPRERLRSVPIASLPSLYIVPPIDDDEWFAELLANRPAPFSVPQQRDGSAS